MRINILHNKIVMDTVTDKFIESFNKNLVPKLEAQIDNIEAVVLYEDYLTDGFMSAGVFYCPLTVSAGGKAEFVFASWRTDAKRFTGGIPYAYHGAELLDFDLPRELPRGFRERLDDRIPHEPSSHIPVRIDCPVPDKTFLAGKYSESFLELLGEFITDAIEKEFRIDGTEDSSLELHLNFSAVSYMEHVVDNVTYRRFGISARACGVRDIWLKWTRTSGKGSFSLRDHVKPDEIVFEIPDDVPEKIREKEYRYLVSQGSASAYKNSMSRKSFTEWRELVKRVIKRGEVIALGTVREEEAPVAEEYNESVPDTLDFSPAGVGGLSVKLSSVFDIPDGAEDEPEEDINPDITALLKGVIDGAKSTDTEEETIEEEAASPIFELPGLALSEENTAPDEEDDLPPFDIDVPAPELLMPEDKDEDTYENIDEDSDEYLELDEIAEREEEERAEELAQLDIDAEPEQAEAEATTNEEHAEPQTEEEAPASENCAVSADMLGDFDYDNKLRDEISRLESELLQKQAECETLKSSLDTLEKKNAAMSAEIQKLRDTVEAAKRADDRERERVAEMAKLAIEEQKLREKDVDIEKEREEKLAEEARLAEESRLAEDARLAEEARRAEEERLNNERLANEEKLRMASEEAAKPAVSSEPVKYVSKTADIIFSHAVDPNITKRIQKIIVETVEYFEKGDIYMKVRANIPEPNVVRLEFLKFPENESALLTDIIRVLGHSRIGITKVLLD